MLRIVISTGVLQNCKKVLLFFPVMEKPGIIWAWLIKNGVMQRLQFRLLSRHAVTKLLKKQTFISHQVCSGLTGKFDLAIRDFTRAIEIDPSNPEAYNNKGCIFLKKEALIAP
ncbi:MAG: tetratricopeptide repeat protein [Bacteroidetes bacterium]|nr:tetratricopeptide repeat protein [Bacteroidota bacterium]